MKIYNSYEKRPMYSHYQRVLCKLYGMPIIWRFLARVIKNAYNIDKSVSVSSGFHCETASLKVGCHSSLSDLYIHGSGPVVIGNHTAISQGCKLITGDHDLNDFEVIIDKTIIIDDYAWLARDTTILAGVSIGRGAVVGAKSVVRNNIPPYAIVFGNPCKVIGFRYTPEEAAAFEMKHYSEEGRITIETLQKNYEKYFLKRIKIVKEFADI